MNTKDHNNILYVVSAEILGMEQSQLKRETDGIGAYLNAFVPAGDALEAGMRVKTALEEDHYKVIRIEEIIEIKNIEFENNDETNFDELKKEALETNKVVYGPFFIFDHDD